MLEGVRRRAAEAIFPGFREHLREREGQLAQRAEQIVREAVLSPKWASVRGRESDLTDPLKDALDQQSTHNAPEQTLHKPQGLQIDNWLFYNLGSPVTNIVDNATALTMGNGVNIEIPDDQRREDGRNAAEAWDEFESNIAERDPGLGGFSTKGGLFYQLVRNTYLFGEMFAWFRGEDEEDGQFFADLRVLDPISNGGISDIDTKPGDIGIVTGYKRRSVRDPEMRTLSPDEVIHWKLPSGGNLTHGRPLCKDKVITKVKQLDQSEQTMWMIQEMRMRLAGVLIYTRADDQADTLSAFSHPAGPTILEVPPGGEASLIDLRNISVGENDENTPEKVLLNSIARAVSMPYHLVAQEYREANLASLQAAAEPTVRLFEERIAMFERFGEAVVRKIVGHRTPGGDPLEVNVNISPVDMRDPAEERRSWHEIWLDGGIDDTTYYTKLGLDPDEIKDRKEEQREEVVRAAESRHPAEVRERARRWEELQKLADDGTIDVSPEVMEAARKVADNGAMANLH